MDVRTDREGVTRRIAQHRALIPSGVGGARTPPQFLTAGDEWVSTIDGIGTITTHFTGPEA